MSRKKKTGAVTEVVKVKKEPSAETLKMRRLTENVKAQFEGDFFVNHPVKIETVGGRGTAWRRLEFCLPMPPSLNNWIRTFRGKVTTSPAARVYKQKVAEELERHRIAPSLRKLEIVMLLNGFPNNSDIDSRQKQLLDAIKGVVCFDDFQFRKMVVDDLETPVNPDGEVIGGQYIKVIITLRD